MDLVQDLHKELQTLLKELPEFASNGFAVFDTDDMEAQLDHQMHPTAAGVMYEGAQPIDGSKGNAATPASAYSGGAVLIEVQFSVIIALQYGYAGQGEDTKWAAFSLLDATRKKILGYRGVNTRPWRYVGERPEIQASGKETVLYSQVWRTLVPVVGTFNN